MTDVVITAGNVVAGSGAVINRSGVAGEAITAGQPIYLDTTTKKYFKADCNSATAIARHAAGIALNAASLNQPIDFIKSGPLTVGGTLVAGSPYYLSSTAGGIKPAADLATGDYICLLGLAASTTVLNVEIQFPGVVK